MTHCPAVRNYSTRPRCRSSRRAAVSCRAKPPRRSDWRGRLCFTVWVGLRARAGVSFEGKKRDGQRIRTIRRPSSPLSRVDAMMDLGGVCGCDPRARVLDARRGRSNARGFDRAAAAIDPQIPSSRMRIEIAFVRPKPMSAASCFDLAPRARVDPLFGRTTPNEHRHAFNNNRADSCIAASALLIACRAPHVGALHRPRSFLLSLSERVVHLPWRRWAHP